MSAWKSTDYLKYVCIHMCVFVLSSSKINLSKTAWIHVKLCAPCVQCELNTADPCPFKLPNLDVENGSQKWERNIYCLPLLESKY